MTDTAAGLPPGSPPLDDTATSRLAGRAPAGQPAVDVTGYVGRDSQGLAILHLLVEGATCGGCVARIERRLARIPEVAQARMNLTTGRLVVRWQGGPERAGDLAGAVAGLGFKVAPYDPSRLVSAADEEDKHLLRAMAVAGFAAANVMLLSVSVWAGHAQGMGPATRDLLHWFSALIALPAIAYAGRPFFTSALAAVRGGGLNMDVPISLAVLLAAGMSLVETATGGPHAYFDSAVALLFFLLVGRVLDRRARGRARSAAGRLLALRSTAVTVLEPDGTSRVLPAEQARAGMTVLVAAGERVAVDGAIVDGRSDVDTSLITGESVPGPVGPGDRVFAGTVNQSAPLRLTVVAVGEDTLLGEIVRLMEAAEQRRSRMVGLADRMARAYAPAVHGLALATFVGWLAIGAVGWQQALLHAIAVLIITCPCALGLAVPAVQVIASSRLMRQGTLLKSGTALERLAAVDTVALDKTGTLTLGRPELRPDPGLDPVMLRRAAALAGASRHPLARALVRAVPGVPVAAGVVETPGCGLSLATDNGRETRLGRRDWCGVAEAGAAGADADGPELWLAEPGRAPVRLGFVDPLRPDAARVVAALRRRGLRIELLSGDRRPTVARVAAELGIAEWQAECRPADKTARLERLAAQGRTVLMVGDGLNDAPALAAAAVSLSPSSAIDISQTAADAVFQGDRLAPVLELLTVARRADRLVRQNFGLSFGYNLVTVPLAMAGLVTPLVAALAMSTSSLVVVGNALRLSIDRRRPQPDAEAAAA